MIATLTLRKPTEARDIARLLLQGYPEHRVFALHGGLGAGKTTLIKAFCAVLGVGDHTSSPSFSIVNEYRSAAGNPIYHLDLYRLREARELHDIGVDRFVDLTPLSGTKAGNFAVAWVLTKFTEPLRFAVTATATPSIARFVGRAPPKGGKH